MEASDHRRCSVALALAGALLLALVSLWFFSGTDRLGRTARLQADAWYYHAWLPTLVLDRDLDLADEYAVFGNFYDFRRTPTGMPSNVFGIGPALFELPLFLAGQALAWLTGAPTDGFSQPAVAAALYGSVLYGCASVFFAWRVLCRRYRLPHRAALVAVLAFLGGPSIYYAVRQPGYAHPFAAFCIAWLIDVLDASFHRPGGPRPWRTWVALGALVGAASLARPQLALWSVVLIFAAADDVRRLRAGRWGKHDLLHAGLRWLGAAVAAIVVFAPQSIVWKLVYGSFIVSPQGAGFMWWDDPAWTSVLFAARNGLLPWTPLYALAALGLVAAVRHHPWTGGALLAGTVLQWFANAAAWDWWAGGAFGGRRFDSCYVAFAFGLGFLLLVRPAGTRVRLAGRGIRVALACVAVALAAANLVLASKRSGANVPIGGGRPAWSVWRADVPGAVGWIAAAASGAANLPARAAFAWRHGVSLDSYDQIVGVHTLDDRYPGLNADALAPWAALALDPRLPNVSGTASVNAPAGAYHLPEGRAQVLVGFNRRDPVSVSLEASVPEGAAGPVRLLLNGTEIAHGTAGPDAEPIVGRNLTSRRGTNVLVIEAPPAVRLHGLAVFATLR